LEHDSEVSEPDFIHSLLYDDPKQQNTTNKFSVLVNRKFSTQSSPLANLLQPSKS